MLFRGEEQPRAWYPIDLLWELSPEDQTYKIKVYNIARTLIGMGTNSSLVHFPCTV